MKLHIKNANLSSFVGNWCLILQFQRFISSLKVWLPNICDNSTQFKCICEDMHLFSKVLFCQVVRWYSLDKKQMSLADKTSEGQTVLYGEKWGVWTEFYPKINWTKPQAWAKILWNKSFAQIVSQILARILFIKSLSWFFKYCIPLQVCNPILPLVNEFKFESAYFARKHSTSFPFYIHLSEQTDIGNPREQWYVY